jgi:sugar lactone lactonase YvrE
MEAKVKKARRAGHVAAILGAVAVAALATAACGHSKSDDGADQNMGSGAGKPSIAQAANDPSFENPVDATPSPDGKDVYFIANTKTGDEDNIGTIRQPAIFKVAAAGGAVSKLFGGAPLVAPFGISISDDGQTLYIADSGADTSDDRSDGRLYTMPIGGGTPAGLAGTDGYAPAGVEVSGESVYFTGHKDGQAGLFKTALGGGAVTPVATGALFADPGGVAVAKNGDAFVVDTGGVAHDQSLASVVKVGADGHTEVLIDGLAVGHPAGIALTADEAQLYVSGFDPAKGTDVVFTIDKNTKAVQAFTDTIVDFLESAGLHRARNADVFAWADGHANATGTVYVLKGQQQ